MRRVLLFAASVALGLHAQIGAPTPGVVRYAGAPLQAVLGVPGSFVLSPLGSPSLARLTAAAISLSDTAALIAGGGEIALFNTAGTKLAAFPYTGAPPVLSLDGAPQSALAWLPDARAILTFDGHAFTSRALRPGDVPGTVTSVYRAGTGEVRLLATQPDASIWQVSLALPSGVVRSVDSVPGARGGAYRLGAFLLWRDTNGLQIENAGGQRFTLASPGGPFTAERMSSHWVHLFFAAGNTHWALALDGPEPLLFRLPGAAR